MAAFPLSPLGAQPSTGYVEAGSARYRQTADLGDMRQVYLRTAVRTNQRDVWQGELQHQQAFGDQGLFVGATNTHTFSPDFYTILSAGTSSGGFFLPRGRVGLTLARTWLPGALVTTVGASYLQWKDDHRDTQFSLGALYYFGTPLVVEAGATWNRSRPGSVLSRNQFLAATLGRERERYLIARIATGNEAYQLISGGRPIVDFRSSGGSLGIRQWVRRTWGVSGTVEAYTNPFYDRRGVTIGAFIQRE